MGKPLDTSRARCDVCGKPYQFGDALYSLASEFDDDHTALLSFRHAQCDTPIEELIESLRKGIDEASKELHGALDRLRRTK